MRFGTKLPVKWQICFHCAVTCNLNYRFHMHIYEKLFIFIWQPQYICYTAIILPLLLIFIPAYQHKEMDEMNELKYANFYVHMNTRRFY